MFFRRKPERNIPEPMRVPITLVQGYEVFTDYVSGLSLIQFSVPYHEWRKLEESKEWKAFQALFENAQDQGINHQGLSRLESPEKLVSQCVPSDSDSLAFRVNLNSRKLFEQSVEPKD